MLATSI